MTSRAALKLYAALFAMLSFLCEGLSFADSLLRPIGEGTCLEHRIPSEYWSYHWCHRENVTQFHGRSHRAGVQGAVLGRFESERSVVAAAPSFDVRHIFDHGQPCEIEGVDNEVPRRCTVDLRCCMSHRDLKKGLHVKSAVEASTCVYHMTICVPALCARPPPPPENPNDRNNKGVAASAGGDGGGASREAIEAGATAPGMRNGEDRGPGSSSANGSGGGEDAGAARGGRSGGGGSPGYRDEAEASEATDMAVMSAAQRLVNRERVRSMFVKAWDAYMYHAWPHGELAPLSCTGKAFDMIKVPAVTLIDSLDTLVVLGNHTEFRRAVRLLRRQLGNGFDFDVNVSVFEANIRLLGGLLSAHMLAVDESLGIYKRRHHRHEDSAEEGNLDNEGGGGSGGGGGGVDTSARTVSSWSSLRTASSPRTDDDEEYDGCLLELALDLGERLLPAFDTPTRIPYGTVNLRRGVPRGETVLSSLAGAGSLSLEFTMLSELTGRPEFGEAGQQAALALFERRTPLGLLGKHVNIRTGKWAESVAGLGSNADSFYEYLLKMYLLFGDEKWWWAFLETYDSINAHMRKGDWFQDVDVYTGQVRRQRFENLMAFWPGCLAVMGEVTEASHSLNAMFLVWRDLGFLPEEYDYGGWQLSGSSLYPLRPELVESIYLVRRSSGDDSWLWAGQRVLDSLLEHAEVKNQDSQSQGGQGQGPGCGGAFASVKNVATLELADDMPSFFLAETLKYLYLVFDDENFLHDAQHKDKVVWTTEAHPFVHPRFLGGAADDGEAEEEGNGGEAEEAEEEVEDGAVDINNEGGKEYDRVKTGREEERGAVATSAAALATTHVEAAVAAAAAEEEEEEETSRQEYGIGSKAIGSRSTSGSSSGGNEDEDNMAVAAVAVVDDDDSGVSGGESGDGGRTCGEHHSTEKGVGACVRREAGGSTSVPKTGAAFNNEGVPSGVPRERKQQQEGTVPDESAKENGSSGHEKEEANAGGGGGVGGSIFRETATAEGEWRVAASEMNEWLVGDDDDEDDQGDDDDVDDSGNEGGEEGRDSEDGKDTKEEEEAASLLARFPSGTPMGRLTLQSRSSHWLANHAFDLEFSDSLENHDRVARSAGGGVSGKEGVANEDPAGGGGSGGGGVVGAGGRHRSHAHTPQGSQRRQGRGGGGGEVLHSYYWNVPRDEPPQCRWGGEDSDEGEADANAAQRRRRGGAAAAAAAARAQGGVSTGGGAAAAAAAAAAGGRRQGTQQVATLRMEGLGVFEVSVFGDGFLVTNQLDGESLEISNVGSGVVSVKNSRPLIMAPPSTTRNKNKNKNKKRKQLYGDDGDEGAEVYSVTANLHGDGLTCAVRVAVPKSWAKASPSLEPADDDDDDDGYADDQHEHDDDREEGKGGLPPSSSSSSSSQRVLRRRVIDAISPLNAQAALEAIPCSVAAFGTAVQLNAPSDLVAAPLLFPSEDPKGCGSGGGNNGMEFEEEEVGGGRGTPTVAAAAKVLHSWFGRPGDEDDRATKEPSPYLGRIVVLERGGCLFQHKVQRAQALGAAAVVVVNSEYKRRFIMSGEASISGAAAAAAENGGGASGDDDDGDDADNNDDADDDDDEVRIPVVMVSREHGDLLRLLSDRLNAEVGGVEEQTNDDINDLNDAPSVHPARAVLGLTLHVRKHPRQPARATAATAGEQKEAANEEKEGAAAVDGNSKLSSDNFSGLRNSRSDNNDDGGGDDDDDDGDDDSRVPKTKMAVKRGVAPSQPTWPKVRVAPNSLEILGMGQWGAFLSSPSGSDWQLFVVKKQPMNNAEVPAAGATPATTITAAASATVP